MRAVLCCPVVRDGKFHIVFIDPQSKTLLWIKRCLNRQSLEFAVFFSNVFSWLLQNTGKDVEAEKGRVMPGPQDYLEAPSWLLITCIILGKSLSALFFFLISIFPSVRWDSSTA